MDVTDAKQRELICPKPDEAALKVHFRLDATRQGIFGPYKTRKDYCLA